jgi:hypothetical protein
LSSGEEFATEKSRKRRKKEKKTQKKSDDKSKSEHEPEDEAQTQRAVVRQESGGLEENQIIQLMDRHVAPHLTQFQHGLHTHINELNNRLEEQICLLYNRQSQMQEQVNYLIALQNQHHLEQFSCNASLGGSFTSDVDKKQDDHNNSGDDSSKVGNATKEILQISGGPQLRSDSNVAQSKPPAKSQSTPERSKDEDNTSRKPRKSKSHDEDKTKVSYYTTFQERIRGEPPAAVNVGANAGLKNSNVSCYSNAILQCLASCIFFSNISPSVNHPEFPLNHAFASLMTSMVRGEQIIDPSSFKGVFMPLFLPRVEEEGEVNADEQQGMYYDFA